MEAAVGFSFFTYFLVVFIPEYSDIIISITGIIELTQQVAIMTSFMCTKRCTPCAKLTVLRPIRTENCIAMMFFMYVTNKNS